jgi:hypothetical protein
MLDFEAKAFNQLRADIEARRNTMSPPLTVTWQRTIPDLGSCFPGYAGHDVMIRNNIITTQLYFDYNIRPMGQKLLSTDELRDVTYAIARWNLDDADVPWMGDTRFCEYRLDGATMPPGSRPALLTSSPCSEGLRGWFHP